MSDVLSVSALKPCGNRGTSSTNGMLPTWETALSGSGERSGRNMKCLEKAKFWQWWGSLRGGDVDPSLYHTVSLVLLLIMTALEASLVQNWCLESPSSKSWYLKDCLNLTEHPIQSPHFTHVLRTQGWKHKLVRGEEKTDGPILLMTPPYAKLNPQGVLEVQ